MPIFARSPRWLVVLLLAGCGPERAEPPVADETFVDVMVALRRAAAEHSGGAPAFNEAREQILADAGVTDSLLYAYVEARADDPGGLGSVFDDIRDALRERPETEPVAEPVTDTAEGAASNSQVETPPALPDTTRATAPAAAAGDTVSR